MSEPMRIAVISHGHPDFSVGGAEMAAYNLHQGFLEHPMVESSVFLGRFPRSEQPTGAVSQRRSGEFLWDQSMHDWMYFRGANRSQALRRLAEWLRVIRPTVIHAHHFAHLGLEIFPLIRRICPQAKIFLTLHEYMAICMHNGQMVKCGGNRLCSHESLDDCHTCFPQTSREDFWLRKRFILRHFDLIDGFISPSHFLRRRYMDWGLAADKITVIENAQIRRPPAPYRKIPEHAPRNRFGFFGQINEYKGFDVLLQALLLAHEQSDVPIYMDVNGANLDKQPKAFRERIEGLCEKIDKLGTLRWAGPYGPDDLPKRMASVDWVVTPSIWWENSPMVIQEAFLHGRPVICSGIGGMAEKVRDGIDGLHAEPRSPLAFAEVLQYAASNVELWRSLVERIPPPLFPDECAESHLSFFQKAR